MAGGEDGGVGEQTVLRVGACNPQRLRQAFEGKMRERVWLRLLSQMTWESILTCIISSLSAATVASATASTFFQIWLGQPLLYSLPEAGAVAEAEGDQIRGADGQTLEALFDVRAHPLQ